MAMFFILFTLGFVVVVMTCMIMINRWMVSKRPKAPDSRDQTDDPHHDPTHDSAHHKDTSSDLKDG
jgi:ABC-type nickel/cobalt efflux system permease component RcnA